MNWRKLFDAVCLVTGMTFSNYIFVELMFFKQVYVLSIILISLTVLLCICLSIYVLEPITKKFEEETYGSRF